MQAGAVFHRCLSVSWMSDWNWMFQNGNHLRGQYRLLRSFHRFSEVVLHSIFPDPGLICKVEFLYEKIIVILVVQNSSAQPYGGVGANFIPIFRSSIGS